MESKKTQILILVPTSASDRKKGKNKAEKDSFSL
ncbi:hypothetical protein SLEP1_g34619 [Rubroshorea leprosula]|uniref:Uncharacterized protein n=1 Tax=Rubroshorea leprosula TaxID=152421 RepID=A0AAV5KKK8_9ROSI|nr:hypothetical protein SLEP1_g34619 [Rubroshorea leprosula]